MLSAEIVRRLTLRPSYAQCCFFECMFTNSLPHAQTYRISISDPANALLPAPELSLVTELNEWSYLKQHFAVTTPIRPNLFLNQAGTFSLSLRFNFCFITHQDHVSEIRLEGNETVFVPFKFQSFSAGDVASR
jgi:hypothetical protein